MKKSRKENLLVGLGLLLLGGGFTLYQIIRWNEERVWAFFTIWFIPIPFILMTSIIAIAGLVAIIMGLFGVD